MTEYLPETPGGTLLWNLRSKISESDAWKKLMRDTGCSKYWLRKRGYKVHEIKPNKGE